ncbi:hypothetical protein ACHAW5_008012 [Stephanodiscus triporus]|uniref:PDZ domain-containing protein n=1 Tax=Stephanodiscus triporus TaxID=2934178 RepID=A0ABD3PR29_9STRA
MVEYRRIESELSSLAKFSPEWFRLKEELFELSIALNDRVDDKDDDDVVEEEEDDTPREINVLLSSPGSTPCDGGDCVSPLSPTAPLCSPREGGEEEEEEEEIRSRPISSPSSTTSRNRRRDRSLDGGRRSLFSSSSPRPPVSPEWFDVKTRIVGLYDQIVRLEKSEGGTAGEFGGAGLDGFSGGRDGGSLGGDGESHTTTKNDESYISGWSSVWSESEDEIWSHADDLECVMVSEALKYQRQQQHSLSCDDDVDEDDAVREDSELLLMPPQSSAAARIGCFVEKQDTEEEDEKLMRSKSPVGVEVKADYLAVEESWQDDAEADKILTSNHDSEVSSAQAVDSMLNEFASLLNGNCKQDDYVEKQNYFAIMIQEQWKKYVACRTLMLMRRRALQYREAQNKKPRKSCQQGCQWQASSAALIQNRWRLYTRCKLLISMRHRAEQYNHQRPQLHFETVAATVIQSHWRKCIRCCEYKQQVNAAVVIQSQLRKYWLTTGKLYTDRREIVFHSPSLGIKLQRGRDGFVRVRSVAEIESPPSYSSTARDGRITHGDIVLDAGGMNLCCPITTSHWVDVVGQIRSAPRPVTFVIANIPRKDVVQATLVIQPRVRLWLTQRVFGRKLDNKKMKAEMETAESSSSDTPDEPEAKVLALSTRLKKGQESAPRLNSIQEELHVMREMEYHHDEEEQKEEDGECPVDLYDSQGDSSTNHQLIVALLRDKFERSAHLSISKEDDNIIVNSPRGSPVPVALSSPNTSPSQEVSSSMDMSELRVSVTNIRQTWESNASSPISPENDVPYSTVRFELRSPEIGFRNVNLAKSRKKERILTPEEKMTENPPKIFPRMDSVKNGSDSRDRGVTISGV